MPKFIVVELLKNGDYIPVHLKGSIREWDRADEASGYAQRLTLEYKGRKFQPRPAKPVDPDLWRKREQERFESGEYKPVPWADKLKVSAECVDHFLHVSQDDPTQVAFTPSHDKGVLDKQTRMSPSKYLAKYYGHIAERVKRVYLAEYRKLYGMDYELKFARTPEEIMHVYETGPDSCMKGFKSTRAYSGPDLAVAYITRKVKGKDHISARVTCWPDKKVYGHYPYGDRELLIAALQEAGFKQGSFKGARMTKFKPGPGEDRYGIGYAMPSFDGYYEFDTTGEYIVVRK